MTFDETFKQLQKNGNFRALSFTRWNCIGETEHGYIHTFELVEGRNCIPVNSLQEALTLNLTPDEGGI